MPEEFEGDLTESVFWGADMRGARFRDVNLAEVRISHAWLIDVEVDAYVDRLVVNGVDVTAYVAEHDPWSALRAVLRPTDADSMRNGWAALRAAWATAVDRAQRLPEEAQHASVNGEWSFVETLRHLVFATDKWFTGPILGDRFQPFGMAHKGASNELWPEVDPDVTPSLTEVLAARDAQAERIIDFLAAMTGDDLARTVDVLENGPHQVRDCIATVLEEEFWHLRYADRDLTVLEAGS
ncbi:MAG: DinB family protein [Actinomycetota bacterium]|nr:DinB family protein [Actinomycetota bacterium]